VTSETRSKNMRAIRSRGNRSTEWRLRAALVQRAISGWELHPSGVLGVPDFYFRFQRFAVFVDGCFWHCCPKCGHIPKTNVRYWRKKLERNRARDRRVAKDLRRAGCKVVRIWECEVRSDPGNCAERIWRILHRKVVTLTT